MNTKLVSFLTSIRKAVGTLISRQNDSLILFDNFIAGQFIQNQTYVGAKTVRLSQIKGSLTPARCRDFDGSFRLRNAHGQTRLNNVHKAMSRKDLSTVSLIQVGNTYFVQDGHHRISIANSNQQSVIAAKVTVVELGIGRLAFAG